jgi:hypothetical protein
VIVPSAPIVIKNDPDPDVYNTPHEPFKEYFLGNNRPLPACGHAEMPARTASTTTWKKWRGYVPTTMFEMLGN